MSNQLQQFPKLAAALGCALSFLLLLGCKTTQRGLPIHPAPLGSKVDEANRTQENNAEAAKFIVYAHEFELNLPKQLPTADGQLRQDDDQHPPDGVSLAPGCRLNDYGLDHVERIARELHRGAAWRVVVERSQSSKRWNTLHQYPVHYNDRLDEARRSVVVAALRGLGVTNADEIVSVASAFPEGLPSEEAIQAVRMAQRVGPLGNAGGAGGMGGF